MSLESSCSCEINAICKCHDKFFQILLHEEEKRNGPENLKVHGPEEEYSPAEIEKMVEENPEVCFEKLLGDASKLSAFIDDHLG